MMATISGCMAAFLNGTVIFIVLDPWIHDLTARVRSFVIYMLRYCLKYIFKWRPSWKIKMVAICSFFKSYSCIPWLWKHILRHQHFNRMSPRSWYIDSNWSFCGCHLENQIWPPSVNFLNGTIVFSDLKIYICLDTKFLIVCHLVAEICIDIFLYGGHLENPIWPLSLAFLNGTVVFINSETYT